MLKSNESCWCKRITIISWNMLQLVKRVFWEKQVWNLKILNSAFHAKWHFIFFCYKTWILLNQKANEVILKEAKMAEQDCIPQCFKTIHNIVSVNSILSILKKVFVTIFISLSSRIRQLQHHIELLGHW